MMADRDPIGEIASQEPLAEGWPQLFQDIIASEGRGGLNVRTNCEGQNECW